jgi:hypothetical protein
LRYTDALLLAYQLSFFVLMKLATPKKQHFVPVHSTNITDLPRASFLAYMLQQNQTAQDSLLEFESTLHSLSPKKILSFCRILAEKIFQMTMCLLMHSPSSASYMFPIAKAIPFWMSGVICSLA